MRHSAAILTRLAGIVSMTGLFVIALLTTLDVALRWLLGAPIEGQADVTEALLPIIIAATFVAAAWGRPHIGVRIAGGLLGERVGRVLDVVADLSLALFFGIIVWQFWRYAGELADEGRQTWVLAVKLAPFWYATTVILALTSLIQVFNAVVSAGGRDAAEPAPPPHG